MLLTRKIVWKQHLNFILHLERIVFNPEVIPRNVREERSPIRRFRMQNSDPRVPYPFRCLERVGIAALCLGAPHPVVILKSGAFQPGRKAP
jgi:hypothetical protein